MPFINNMSSQQSTVVGWQRRDVRGKPAFPTFKPKYATSDSFSNRFPTTGLYRKTISPAQVYTSSSRTSIMRALNGALCGLPDDKTLQIRWRPNADKPAFSLEFLQMYLTRKYGPLTAIYQQAVNSCLVVFENPNSAFMIIKDPKKGSPHGRLFAKWWNPQPQDDSFYKVMKHLEKAAQTKARFNEVMDRVDRIGYISQLHSFSRALSVRNKTFGPSMLPVLVHGQNSKGMFKVITAEREELKPQEKTETSTIIGSTSTLVPDAETTRIKNVTSNDEFKSIVLQTSLVLVKFHAQWCGPCKVIAPMLDHLSKEYTKVTFLAVDTDELEETVDFCNIVVLPTFQFYIKGRLVDELRGNAVEVLKEKLSNMERFMAEED
ncbi:hypothetical protein RRG08_042619 [Elysia crispata]|uniref:Thioredoxin domain-containing protein n=1 Tax=Elysia crispata TaxID=231223 RepID=A0AAE0XPY9_9GAST|nr:hypothetical protein RRG08_042619 [Elysia crispata]